MCGLWVRYQIWCCGSSQRAKRAVWFVGNSLLRRIVWSSPATAHSGHLDDVDDPA